jgi:hypothetical protein
MGQGQRRQGKDRNRHEWAFAAAGIGDTVNAVAILQ